MARLRSDAKMRAAQRQAEAETMATALPSPLMRTPPRIELLPAPEHSQLRHDDLPNLQNLVAVIGEDPPPGSQEFMATPPRRQATPAYTWECTSPTNGRDSEICVLHLGSTPQPSPMSRDPPNLVVNHGELTQAMRGSSSHGRRRQGRVGRRLLDPTDVPPVSNVKAQGVRGGRGRLRGGVVRSGRSMGRAPQSVRQVRDALGAPPGWEAPEILLGQRSPYLLRARIPTTAGRVIEPVEGEVFVDITAASDATYNVEAWTPPRSQREAASENTLQEVPPEVQFFYPGASPPGALVQDPVHSPSEHGFVQNRAFPETLMVTVPSVTLNLDPGLVGDEHGLLSGMVVSRFFHHVTGTPMFQVDFGGGIGARSVPVSASAVDKAREFEGVQRTLFASNKETQRERVGPSELPVQAESDDDDPDWHGQYEDFPEAEEPGETVSDDDVLSYTEDPLRELGLYNYDEDVSNWPFQRVFADDQWQDQSITLVQNTNNFSGPEPGPTSPVANHPSDYFLRFWPPEILQRVVDETNGYAAQPSHVNSTVTNGRPDWTPLESEELLAWFGILMLMGLKEFPDIRCYWSRKPFYNCPLISEAMPRKRFEAIIRCVHLVNNEALVNDKLHPAYDRLAKVRWLCESFASMSQRLYNNERVLTVDEIMIPYKGRFCNIRQYMKSKPVKFGVKVWALANSESRYVSNIIVYLGADATRAEGDSVGEDAVFTAIAGLEGRGHVIITDNFFTSPRLFTELLKRGFWATGTCRKTRKGFPTSLAGFPNTQLPERGHLVLKMHRSRQIAAICWMDAKPVFLLSTACDPIGEDSYAGRWVGRERVEFPTSPILLQYQAGMRGVDLVDQQRQEYTVQLHSHKWWHRIFMFLLDSQLLNSYILYACDRRALGLPLLSRSLWHYTLAEYLIRPRMRVGHIRGPIRNLAAGGLHFSEGHPVMRRRCVVCNRRTRRMCPGCGGMFQCEGACYRVVHTQRGYQANMQVVV